MQAPQQALTRVVLADRGHGDCIGRLLQDSESEGGGSGSSAGCFPDFYTAQDFDDWLQGTYQGVPAFPTGIGVNCTLSAADAMHRCI